MERAKLGRAAFDSIGILLRKPEYFIDSVTNGLNWDSLRHAPSEISYIKIMNSCHALSPKRTPGFRADYSPLGIHNAPFEIYRDL